jgi:hypothetical protein
MRNNGKSEAPETPRPTGPLSVLSDWVQQGTSSFFATQRILLDLITRQNAMAVTALRETLAATRPAPGTILTEMAGEGVSNFIGAQKVLLDLAHRQTEIVMKGVKERAGTATPAAAISDGLRRSVGIFINLQQHFLEVADKQTQAWVRAAKTGKTFTGEGLAELAREGMDAFIESQKKFLDIVAQEAAKMDEEAAEPKKPSKRTELTELARRSTEAFIDAQKKLLDLAGKQWEVNLKTAQQTMDAMPSFSAEPLRELTRQGVESLGAAQEALLDVVSTRRHRPAAQRPAAKPRPKTRTAHKPATA